jgi:uncharacterized protein with NRDE domain
MCLIVLAWRARPDFPLIVAANRDEFHARPAAAAAFWRDHPRILAGRDLEAHGTWMGVSRAGRFAAVTNFRGAFEPHAAESRGALVTQFLDTETLPGKFMGELKANLYSGFSLLVADGEELWWMSNRETERSGTPRRLEPGIYGLGNTLLDAPEIDHSKARLRAAIEPGPAVETLLGVLGPARIVNPQYGTRCSTVLLKAADGRVRYAERPFAADGAEGETVSYEF